MSTHTIHTTQFKGFTINEEMQAGRTIFTFFSDADPESTSGWAFTLDEARVMIEDILDEEREPDEPWDGFRDDVEADADALASAGFGTDEDYGYYGGDDY